MRLAQRIGVLLVLCAPSIAYIAWQVWRIYRNERAYRQAMALLARAAQLPTGDPERMRLLNESMKKRGEIR